MKHASLCVAAVMLAACATTAPEPTGPASGALPSGELNLGDWRTATEAATLTVFQDSVTSRYGAGVSVSAATADLRAHQFTCAAAPPQDQGRGDPPAEICRRTVTLEGCTHTWQVHLFGASDEAHVSPTRALYDRRCGNEGLLGGPG